MYYMIRIKVVNIYAEKKDNNKTINKDIINTKNNNKSTKKKKLKIQEDDCVYK